jgi:hypothetical protein
VTPRPATRIDIVGPGAFGWRSGGTTYNQRLMAGLGELGVDVRDHVAPGAWPEGSAADRAALSALLRGIAADGGGTAIVDGLVGLGCPDELREAERAGLAVWVLVHSSLVDLAPSGTPDSGASNTPPSRSPRASSRRASSRRAASPSGMG